MLKQGCTSTHILIRSQEGLKQVKKVLKKLVKKAVILTKSMNIAQVASIAIDFIPVVENGKAAFETAFGYDLVAIEKWEIVIWNRLHMMPM